VQTLAELVAHLRGEIPIAPAASTDALLALAPPTYATDFAEVRGQEHVKRALEVAAAGGHNVLLAGPLGAGKTLLARALPSILPAMDPREALEAAKVYSGDGAAVQRGDRAQGGARLLCGGGGGAGAARGGDGALAALGPGVPPRAQAGARQRRPGGERVHRRPHLAEALQYRPHSYTP
jgi:energy-coupling factor transporter ATP-binding protein EcfA2